METEAPGAVLQGIFVSCTLYSTISPWALKEMEDEGLHPDFSKENQTLTSLGVTCLAACKFGRREGSRVKEEFAHRWNRFLMAQDTLNIAVQNHSSVEVFIPYHVLNHSEM